MTMLYEQDALARLAALQDEACDELVFRTTFCHVLECLLSQNDGTTTTRHRVTGMYREITPSPRIVEPTYAVEADCDSHTIYELFPTRFGITVLFAEEGDDNQGAQWLIIFNPTKWAHVRALTVLAYIEARGTDREAEMTGLLQLDCPTMTLHTVRDLVQAGILGNDPGMLTQFLQASAVSAQPTAILPPDIDIR